MTNQSVNDSDGRVTQVAGDYNHNQVININKGLCVEEVNMLAKLFLKENFPILKEEAMEVARNNVDLFLKELEIKIEQKINQIMVDALKSPDVQNSLNDAVIGAAKRGLAANVDILSSLVIERICSDSEDYISMVAAESIQVVSRLTREQIGFLTLVWFFNNTLISSAKGLPEITPFAYQILELAEPSFDISESKKAFLEYAGCGRILNIVSNSPYTVWKQSYKFLENVTDDELKENINNNFHVLKVLADAYSKTKVYEITLSPIGQMIAATNFASIDPDINYSNWIN